MSAIVVPKFIPIADIYATKTKRKFLSYEKLFDIHLPDGTILKKSIFDVQKLIDEYSWLNLLESIVVQLDHSEMYRLIYSCSTMNNYVPRDSNIQSSGVSYTIMLIYAICHIKHSTKQMQCEAKLILARLLGCSQIKHPQFTCRNTYQCFRHDIGTNKHRISKDIILTSSLQSIVKLYLRSAQYCQSYVQDYQKQLQKTELTKLYKRDADDFCKKFLNFDDGDVGFLVNGMRDGKPIVSQLINGSVDMTYVPNYRKHEIARLQKGCIVVNNECSHKWAREKGYKISSHGCIHLEDETINRMLSESTIQSPVERPLVQPSAPPLPASTSCDNSTSQTHQDMSCVVCQSTQKCTLFLPCKHLCACDKCSENLKQCPMCRSQIQSQIKVYI